MAEKFRVLLLAESANPEFVSVPLVGWSAAEALRRVADVHLVTQVRNREAILRAGLVEGKDFTAIDSERLARPMWVLANALRMGEGKGWTTIAAISALSYPYFEALVWKQFKAAIKAGSYDIVHRVTPLTPTQGSPIAARCRGAGIPFVLGPLNGGVPWPPGFDSERRREREWLSYVRRAYKLLPGIKRSYAASSAILVGSRHTQGEVPVAYQDRTVYLPENGIDTARFSRRADPGRRTGPLRVGFIGRMVPYKGPDMLLAAALPLVEAGQLQVEFIGDGPTMPELRSMAEAAGVGEGVRFHGWVPHTQVQDILVEWDLLGFPSIREFGGGVVLEAMALGVPPLVVDYAGPGELVSEGRGYKIPLGSRDAIISRLREQLLTLCNDRSELAATGTAARAWVNDHFTWAAKAQQILATYAWVRGDTDRRPNFF